MGNTGNTKGSKGRAAERRLHAFELFKGGTPYRQIGRQLGVSECQAHRDVHAVLAHLDALEANAAKQYRRAILERDREMIHAAYPLALKGDLQAARLVVLIHRELRDLLGLDAADRVNGQGDPEGLEPLLAVLNRPRALTNGAGDREYDT